tara:strand:+ start:1256 stop:2113 length:858 start_codon:yes stop_codon:yes gene_type:complete
MNAGKHRQLYRIIYYQLIQRHIFAITGFIRVIPDFLVIGAKRCGTTSLYQHLPEHPCISKSPYDNMGFFNDNFHLGVNWYKSFFPTTFTRNKIKSKFGGFLAFDVTTKYMEEESTANNVYQTKPNMKIIIILRNPVDRAYSQYHLSVRQTAERRSFEDVVEENMNRLNKESHEHYEIKPRFSAKEDNYLKKGLYALQLRYWLKIFPRENILTVSTEEFESNQQIIYNKIFEFLNISKFEVKNTKKMEKGNYPPIKSETRNLLLDYFRPHNHELFELINMEFDWDK